MLKGRVKLLSRRQSKKKKGEDNTKVDVLVELENGHKIVIEMNANGFYDNIKRRNMVYLSRVLSAEYKVGDKKLINFNVKSTLFNGSELKNLVNDFELREQDNDNLEI